MTGFSLKLKSKNGQFVVSDLNAGTTIADLKTKISQVTQINPSYLHILIGFPPKPLDLSHNDNSLSATGISSGDTLIVEEKIIQNIEDDAAFARRLQEEEDQEMLSASEVPSQDPSNPFVGILMKKIVPADNSCLFTSIGYVLNGKVSTDCGSFMRKIIATQVSADPVSYNDGVLGKPNAEYCEWIQRSESWGGAIEVAILSNFYGIEIDVVDIQNSIINRFGEDKNYGLRVFLLFDGIHYDPLYMESAAGDVPATMFPIEELGVYQQAELLAKEANSSRQFTDVEKFSLRCMQCDVMLVGQVQAQQHAKSTGHTNFGEI
ncbi:ubiquitin thioesterase OTU1 [Eupeodes corollae]|uniref:ubiquitin thioesterase OTU1 n=1 Tax=Eupeodes corollae TaxID=290404 RepID=UPI0024924496|nr:ubiquitin thioesterase OTU1 [Eupeodes corollae]